MRLQNQTCSAPQACTTAAWGLLAILRLPFLQSLYISIFTKLQPLTELPLYIFLQGLVRLSCTSPQLVHLNVCTLHLTSCTSTRAPHLVNLTSCTSTRAPHLVHLTSCTSTRAPHLVHLTSCTSTHAPLRVHLVHISCVSMWAPLCVHLNSCTSTRAPHLACTSRASFALVHPSSPSVVTFKRTWTIPIVTV